MDSILATQPVIARGITITTGEMASKLNKIADFVYSGIRPDRPKAVASLDGSR